jgi:CubicO group peptidase (beta-lactamase class C family)
MQARATIAKNGVARTIDITAPIPWWSFTKTALAIAVMRLSNRGRVDLDEAVEGRPYTPAQLLRHEAGLPDYGTLQSYHAAVEAGHPPWPIDDLLTATQADRLRYEPGQGWAYSNVGYWHVARLIETASGRPLADALAHLVFSPVGLATPRLATVPADLVGVCMGDAIGYHPGWVYHGLIVGTAMDAARLLRCLLEGGLVERGTLARMLQPRPLPQFRSALHPDPAYGLGLMLRARNPLDGPIGHSGSGPGSRIAVYARRGTTCVTWAATTCGIDAEADALSACATAPG